MKKGLVVVFAVLAVCLLTVVLIAAMSPAKVPPSDLTPPAETPTLVDPVEPTPPAPVVPTPVDPARVDPTPVEPTPVDPTPPVTGTVTVSFIDVGQGDAILVDYGTYEVLIDCGSDGATVVSYLRDRVDGDLEVMVATHPHADHIGGLTGVLRAFSVDEIWTNGATSTSKTYATFANAVQAEGAETHVARRGDKIVVSDLTFNVLSPVSTSCSTNNGSVVLSMSYGQTDFLFMGDAEQEAEASMVSARLVPDVEILKVGHHGSRTASSPSFLSKARPEVAVYMAGAGNSYGHPHAETTAALRAIGATIYGTDVQGDIMVSTNGVTYAVSTQC